MPQKQSGRRKPSEDKGKAASSVPQKNREVKPRRGKQRQCLRDANRGQEEAAEVRKKEAFELRAQKLTYRQIADRLGVSVKTAFDYVNEYWAHLQCLTAEKAEVVRQMELDDLDQMHARWFPLAVHEGLNVSKLIEGPDGEVKHIRMEDYDAGLKAVEKVLKIQERRAKLLGLDAALKVEGEIKHTHLTLDEFKKRVREAGA